MLNISKNFLTKCSLLSEDNVGIFLYDLDIKNSGTLLSIITSFTLIFLKMFIPDSLHDPLDEQSFNKSISFLYNLLCCIFVFFIYINYKNILSTYANLFSIFGVVLLFLFLGMHLVNYTTLDFESMEAKKKKENRNFYFITRLISNYMAIMFLTIFTFIIISFYNNKDLTTQYIVLSVIFGILFPLLIMGMTKGISTLLSSKEHSKDEINHIKTELSNKK